MGKISFRCLKPCRVEQGKAVHQTGPTGHQRELCKWRINKTALERGSRERYLHKCPSADGQCTPHQAIEPKVTAACVHF